LRWSRRPNRRAAAVAGPISPIVKSSIVNRVTFAHPYFLLLLLLLPVLAWLKDAAASPAVIYSSVQLVRAVLNVTRSRSAGAAALAVVALGCSLLRWPNRPHEQRNQSQRQRVDIWCADMSQHGSEDFKSATAASAV